MISIGTVVPGLGLVIFSLDDLRKKVIRCIHTSYSLGSLASMLPVPSISDDHFEQSRLVLDYKSIQPFSWIKIRTFAIHLSVRWVFNDDRSCAMLSNLIQWNQLNQFLMDLVPPGDVLLYGIKRPHGGYHSGLFLHDYLGLSGRCLAFVEANFLFCNAILLVFAQWRPIRSSSADMIQHWQTKSSLSIVWSPIWF